MKIKINQFGKELVEDFANGVMERKAMDRRDFRSGSVRTSNDYKADIVLGKLAEVAFSIAMDWYRRPIELDWGIYDGGDGGNDILGTDKRFDIKATRMYSRFLTAADKNKSDYYIFVKVDLPRNWENSGRLPHGQITCDLVGWTTKDSKLWSSVQPGGRLYDPNKEQFIGPKLKGYNDYMHEKFLIADLGTLVGTINQALGGQMSMLWEHTGDGTSCTGYVNGPLAAP